MSLTTRNHTITQTLDLVTEECCNRSFKDLARHMAGQHPDYADGGES